MKDDLRIPEIAVRELNKSLRAPNALTLVIQGHFTVERFILSALGHSFREKPSLDLERLPFSIKIQIAEALGCIKKESMPLFIVFNKARNRLAHNPFTTFSEQDLHDLRNSFSKHQRQMSETIHKKRLSDFDEVEIFRWAILAMCSELRGNMVHRLRHKISHDLQKKELDELIADLRKSEPVDQWEKEFDEQVESELKTFLAGNKAGDPKI